MLLIASAQAANILVSLARMKLLALLTGPAGVGVLGIYNSLQSTAATVADLGLGNSGVREIAAAKDNPAVLSRVRRVLFAASLVQGCIATALMWFQRERIANWLFGDTGYSSETGMVGIAVLLTLISASQTALLQGLRRISDLGKVTVLSAMTGTLAGLFAVRLQGEGGLIWFLIAQPASAVLVAWWFTRRVPGPAHQSWTAGAIWRVWKPMAALGTVFMLAGLSSTMTLLLVRGMVRRDLGLEAAGLFAASWAIAMTYIGFLLSAMGADYYPQLVEVIADRVRANRLMNDQMQLGLALGGPILLALTGLAPWVMALLYSKEFIPAAEMLQWQSFGNVLKLAAWPLSFALVAAARSRIYLCVELGWNFMFLGFIWTGLSAFGLQIAGTGFAAAYLGYLITLRWTVGRLSSFRFARLSAMLLATHLILSASMLALAHAAPRIAAVAGILLAFATGFAGLRIVLAKIGPEGRFASRLTAFFATIRWPVRTDK
ncbi:MAG: O-antigen translocase [Mesorhizobium sp.]|uniref:O-antigen translocase n=1 Tax=Mesorhizobium sp. TaxID=1871066 RepID=UPI00120AC03F|nr:O-antigen translocase [Mesorhizobium sp.]TIP05713.1 MAG: O-antigen translocase [Mesorhizobium sp.]